MSSEEEFAVKMAARAAEELSALYNECDDDFAECMHRNSPNPRNVVRALRLLIDVLLPGRNTEASHSHSTSSTVGWRLMCLIGLPYSSNGKLLAPRVTP